MHDSNIRKLVRKVILKEMTRDDETRVRDLVRIELTKLYRTDYSDKVDDQIDKKLNDKSYDKVVYDLIRKFMRKHHQLMHQDYRFYLDKVKP